MSSIVIWQYFVNFWPKFYRVLSGRSLYKDLFICLHMNAEIMKGCSISPTFCSVGCSFFLPFTNSTVHIQALLCPTLTPFSVTPVAWPSSATCSSVYQYIQWLISTHCLCQIVVCFCHKLFSLCFAYLETTGWHYVSLGTCLGNDLSVLKAVMFPNGFTVVMAGVHLITRNTCRASQVRKCFRWMILQMILQITQL